MSGWSFAEVWSGIARAVGDRDALVSGEQSVTWGAFEDRAARLAGHFHAEGLRAGDKIAIAMTNRPEYLESFFAALLIGCVPVNVNYRYVADEMHYVLDDSDAKAVVHSAELAKTVRTAVKRIPKGWRPILVGIGEHHGAPSRYESAIAAGDRDGEWRSRPPDGDDLIFLYTGGTTGSPKGVMWRNDDLYVALWQMSRPGTEPPDPVAAAAAGKRAATAFPACPLMHGTGLFISLSTLAGAGTVVLDDHPGLDPKRLWDTVERRRVQVLTIVGDAFARPLLAELDAHPDAHDLSSLRAVTSSGVTWSPETKEGLLRHLPDVTLIDSLGASEGMMTRNTSTRGSEIEPARFAVSQRVKVIDEETGREVTPGSDEVGLLAVTGHIPIGYYNDPEKTAATFRVVDGVRYSVPGDYATVDEHGTIRLLGRGSACINTGGEKVYPEEIELALRKHKSVFDCVVVGVPDERFGEAVVALVVVADNHYLDEEELHAWCRGRMTGYKKPKRFFFVPTLNRSAAGKASYRHLRELAADLVRGASA